MAVRAAGSPAHQTTANSLMWIADGSPSHRAEILLETLAQAEASGVCSRDYGVAEIRNQLAQGSADYLAAADALLTEGLFRYANEIGGRNTRDKASLAAAALEAEDFRRFIAELAPTDPEYLRLRSALDFYHIVASSGGWASIPSGPALKRGMVRAQIADLRRRLAITGDFRAGGLKSTHFDGELEAAVRRFQARHGLRIDGIVGKETSAAFNVPVQVRAATLAANLCRYPRIAAKQHGTAIVVNIPGAGLKFFRDDKLVFSSAVIVGRNDWPTPIFSDEVSAIELNPYWNIPPRIARNEVLPRIVQDPRYLETHNIRVLSERTDPPGELDPSGIDWQSVGTGPLPFRLRQDPGPENPMGLVKFRLDNPYHVFLHDTPAKHLFDRSKRNLSHGCVRVQEALRLAALLLDAGSQAPAEVLQKALDDGAPLTIRLSEPVPVHLINISAWVDEDGTVQFRRDAAPGENEKSCTAAVNPASGII